MDKSGQEIRDRVRRFIEDSTDTESFSYRQAEFSSLFCELASLQYRKSQLLRRYWDTFSSCRAGVSSWDEVIPLPVQMFKSFEVRSYKRHADERVWQSSGTTGQKSQHFMANTSIYDLVIKKLWIQPVISSPGLRTIRLIPTERAWPNSSLAHFFSVGHMNELSSSDNRWISGIESLYVSVTGSLPFILDVHGTLRHIRACEQLSVPVRLVGTSYALVRFMEELEVRRETRVLPAVPRSLIRLVS